MEPFCISQYSIEIESFIYDDVCNQLGKLLIIWYLFRAMIIQRKKMKKKRFKKRWVILQSQCSQITGLSTKISILFKHKKLFTKKLRFLAVEQRLRCSVMYDVLTYLKPYRSATDVLFTLKACLSTCYLSTNYPWISN